MARPPIGARPLTIPARPGDSGGSRSTSVAPIAVIASPVATPWTMRARASTATPPATMKIAIARASRLIETAITGRRPTWSERRPRTSRVASRPKT